MIDAVIRAGGKQYRVQEGSVLDVATIDAEPGSSIELRDVLLVADDGNITIGSPSVDGAVVVAEVIEHGRGKKVINFKFKAKVRYRRKRGHRQGYTRLSVTSISVGGAAPNRARRRTAEEPAPGADAEAETIAAAETAPEASTTAPRRRRSAATPDEADTPAADDAESTETKE